MTNLNLSSNYSENKLFGVGEAKLHDEKIYITAEPNTMVTLLRGANKVVLLKASDQQLTTSGLVLLDDVYTLENGNNKLVIKVEPESTKHETNLYIDSEPVTDATSAKRKTTLTAGILILTLLIISVVFGVKQKKIKEFNQKSEESLTIALSQYEEKTRESFVKSKEIAIKLKNDGYKNEKLDELLKNIESSEADVLGEVRVETKELVDLTLQISGFNGNSLVSTGETMFVFDKNQSDVIKFDINGKDAEIVAKKDVLDGARDIASYEDRLFSLNNDGIYEIDETRLKVKDNEWGNSLFYLYSGNIYLVDKDNNQIYRYSGSPAGGNKTFGNKSEWLAPGIEADFSKVIDMSIDGSIWLLSSSGKVTRFTNGNPTSITLNGIVTSLSDPTAIYTNEKLKYVYVLDKNEGRVVVLEKNGNFKVQYMAEGIKSATDLVVSEEEGKIILLSGSKLMYIETSR